MTSVNPIVIYHGNCADGFGAAWVFKSYGGREFDFHAGVYSDAPPDVAGRDVYLVDFSYRRAVVEQMLDAASSITLIDHHKTAIDDLEPLIRNKDIGALVSLEHSGAVLAWMWTHGGSLDGMPPLLAHIEDRDLWRFALPGTRAIQANVFSHPYDFEAWNALMATPTINLLAGGEAIERKHHKDIAELVAVCKRRMNISGYDVWVASLPYTLASDAGHLMAAAGPFAACYWDTPEHRIFSLRSQDEGLDVSDIAKQYGGGGHVHAAGFRVDRNHPLAQS